MSRRVKYTGASLLAVLIVLQFFQPEKNSHPVNPEQDMLTLLSPPGHIAVILREACYDCHSNQTRYPWYDRVSPVSWYLNSHVKEGKKDMNYSDYGSLDKLDRIGVLSGSCDVVDATSMPLQSYLWIHKGARLSQEDREAFCAWTEEEALKEMRK